MILVFKSAGSSKIHLKVFKALAKAICETSGIILRTCGEENLEKGKDIVHLIDCLD